jgi:hypothetical protein
VPSQIVQATPRAATCTSPNAVVQENCFPGSTGWKTLNATRAYDNGIEGFTSSSSVDRGGSVDLKVKAGDATPFHIDIYRTGGYNGLQGRLVSSIRGLTADWQGPCDEDSTGTGVNDCSSWSVATTLTTSSDWPSGVYLLKLIRDDNGNANEVLLIVRRDSSPSQVLYQVPTTTYQAYNGYGKGLYEFVSGGPNTIAGTSRAVKVSFDRPYNQPVAGPVRYDWYTRTDIAAISWMEQQGYDVSYAAAEDLDASPTLALGHKALVSGVHDEYWSTGMLNAWKAARDQGTSLFFLGANAAYWRIRFENSLVSGASRRVEVDYKTIQSGPTDPVSPTTTWRDPAGPNQPENALLGQMYIGDNSNNYFPLQVTAAQGRNRVWRYTPLADLASGTTSSIGTSLVGWEWDSRVNNGKEPAGVTTVAASPVTGNLVQNNGASYLTGPATQNTTIYRASAGGLVFATGTNQWSWGLAKNVDGNGEPNIRIQQATANVLSDMGVAPATPDPALTTDGSGPLVVASTTPAANASGVQPNQSIKVVLDRQLDPSTVDNSSVTLTPDGGSGPVSATVKLDNPTKTITVTPAETLDPFLRYTGRVSTSIRSWTGEGLTSPYSWSFVTGPGTPPVVTASTPAAGATGAITDGTITATFDRRLLPSSVTTSTVSVAPTSTGSAVAATVAYDDATRTVRLTPSARLDESRSYTVTITTGLQAIDGTPMAAPATFAFTTGTNLKITSRTPAPFSTGLSPSTPVRVVFSRAADPATVTTSTVKLLDASNNVVPATVSYDGTARAATLVPSAPLSLLTTYTAVVMDSVRATDGAPVDGSTWTFSTAASPPPAPTVSGVFPAAGSTNATNGTTIRASFDQPIDPATLTAQTFTLTPQSGGSPVAANVTYDATLNRAVLTPLAPLDTAAGYTAAVTTGVRSTTGAPLGSTVTWTFTTADCPCSLMPTLAPTQTGIPVRDGRGGTGPWTYELGTRFTVNTTTSLTALKFWKDAQETGTHVGRVWNAAGTQLASVTYQNESASGWQRQALGSPLTLNPGQVYTMSVGLNMYYVNAKQGLGAPLSSGPATTLADGSNGSFNLTAGSFPNQSWNATNYFVDGVFKLPTSPARTPAVTTRTPAAGATGVAVSTKVTATFNVGLDSSTVTTSSVTLKAGTTAIPASVAYNDDTQTITLTPNSALDTGTTYTVTLGTAIRSDDETPLSSPVSWTFSTIPPTAPVVTSTSPSSGAANAGLYAPVTATFDQSLTASTVTTSTFTLTPAGGSPVAASVSYDSATRTATLTPSAPLAGGTSYTARLTTGIRSAKNVALPSDVTWQFTTNSCPCRLFADTDTPSITGLSTANGRSGGPWTLELGVKVEVTQPARMTAIRFWKDPAETGAHVGRVWTTSGVLLGSTTFAGESASGWQEQALTTPLDLTPGQQYVVSVGYNASFGMTGGSVLRNGITSGPLRSVVDNSNGVFADAAGTFPTQTWFWGNYFVDAVVR